MPDLSPLRVYYLIDGNGGGAMSQVLDLAAALPPGKVLPRILFFTPGAAVEEAAVRGIPYDMILYSHGQRVSFLGRLTRYLKDNPCDILHTHTINGNLFGRLAGKLAGVPELLTTVHSHIIDELKGLKEPSLFDNLRYRLDLLMSRWNKKLVVVSDDIMNQLQGAGIASAKLKVINNTVDPGRFHPDQSLSDQFRDEWAIPREAGVIGIIGRMVPLKNHSVFLNSARGVLDVDPEVFFVLVGDGPLLGSLKKQARDLGIEDRVIFTGWRSDIERVVSGFDVLVICSQVEGLNVTILEAMACEKPIVGTDVRGIQSLVADGIDGILVPPGDESALCRGIVRILGSPSTARAMGSAGREKVVARYSTDAMVCAYLDVYKELIPA